MISLSNSIRCREEKVKAIVEKVCVLHGLYPHTLFVRHRKRPVVESRQLAWYLIRNHVIADNGSKISLAEIGQIANLWGIDLTWDHASILHAVKSISGRRDVDKLFDAHIMKIEGEVVDVLHELDSQSYVKDQYKPTVHFHNILGRLNYSLCIRNDSEEVDLLINTLDEKRIKEQANQDSQQDLEMEVVQGATD